MLDVHHEIQVVQQHPALQPVALAAYRLGVVRPQRLLDAVDDRTHLALVGRGDDQEDVGDRQLVGHVVGDQIGAQLVHGGRGGDPGQLQGVVGRGQGLSSRLGIPVFSAVDGASLG